MVTETLRGGAVVTEGDAAPRALEYYNFGFRTSSRVAASLHVFEPQLTLTPLLTLRRRGHLPRVANQARGRAAHDMHV